MITAAPSLRHSLVHWAKRGLVTVVLVGVLFGVSALSWRLAMLPANGSDDLLVPEQTLVIGPLTSPLGLQTWRP